MAKKALLLGGTGAIGAYLTHELLKCGFHVDVTTREQRQTTKKNLKYLKGNAHDFLFLSKVLKNKKYNAVIDFMGYSTTEFEARCSLLLQSTGHYVYLSSYRVFADTSVITEDSPKLLDITKDKEYLATDEYALAKARQEDILRKTKKKNWTIIRPAITYSRNRFQLGVTELDTNVWRAVKGLPTIMPKEMLSKTTTMTWAGDVARLISKIVLNNKAYGEDYNIATREHHKWGEVVDIYRKIIGLEAKEVTLNEYIEALGGGYKKYQVNYDRLFDRVLDNSKILQVTGETQNSFKSLEDGLRLELERFLKKPQFTALNYEKQAKIDRLTGSRLDVRKLTPPERELYLNYNPTFLLKIKRALRIRTRINRIVSATYNIVLKKHNIDGAILTLTGYHNYGNILQRYALQKFLKKHGYNFVSYMDGFSAVGGIYKVGIKVKAKTPFRAIKRAINKQKPYWYLPSVANIHPEISREENLVEFVNKHIMIKSFNPTDDFKNYIVGSDQVWRDWWGNRNAIGYYFLNFLKGKQVNRVAYAASFGKDKIEGVIKPEDIEYLKPYIQSFASISVREQSAVQLLDKIWGVDDVRVVVDPTLLLDKKDYSTIIDRSNKKLKSTTPIFSYVLAMTPQKRAFIHKVSEELDLPETTIHPRELNKLPKVEQWLKGFRDTELIITDSFHGTVFSIINNTPFLVIENDYGGNARISTLLEQFRLKDRLVKENELNKITPTKVRKSINWDYVNKKLIKSREDSGKWLLDSLRK